MSAVPTLKQEQTALGDEVWVLTCEHGSASSDAVARTFSKDLLIGCYLFWAEELPAEVSDAVVSLVALRTLLGRLLELRAGCSCGLAPFPLGVLPGAGDGGPLS